MNAEFARGFVFGATFMAVMVGLTVMALGAIHG